MVCRHHSLEKSGVQLLLWLAYFGLLLHEKDRVKEWAASGAKEAIATGFCLLHRHPPKSQPLHPFLGSCRSKRRPMREALHLPRNKHRRADPLWRVQKVSSSISSLLRTEGERVAANCESLPDWDMKSLMGSVPEIGHRLICMTRGGKVLSDMDI